MTTEANSGSAIREIVVPDGQERVRIDKFLSGVEELGLTRNRIQTLFDNGLITIDGIPIPKKYELRGGEVILMSLPPARTINIVAEDIPLTVVYEDSCLMVINKPAGLVTHPAPGNYSGTLVHALLHHLKERPGGGEAIRPGIVHRLDKDTTGLIVIAKTAESFSVLQSAMQKREVSRTYAALVWGHLKENEGSIETLIGRSQSDRTKMAVLRKGGREAITKYHVVDRFRSYDLIDVTLVTGRTHQIRVHLSHVGHPVFGDHEYSGRLAAMRGLFAPERPLAKLLLSQIDRQALHARSLQFKHPISGEAVSFVAPLPADFASVLKILSEKGR